MPTPPQHLSKIFTKTSEENIALRDICRQWQHEHQFWSYEKLSPTLDQGTCLLYIPTDSPRQWKGAVLAQITFEFATILYVYTSPDHRKNGIGRKLFQDLISHLRNQNTAAQKVERLYLEVRPSNTAALKLYESFGMTRVRVRKRYYADGEDGLELELNL